MLQVSQYLNFLTF